MTKQEIEVMRKKLFEALKKVKNEDTEKPAYSETECKKITDGLGDADIEAVKRSEDREGFTPDDWAYYYCL